MITQCSKLMVVTLATLGLAGCSWYNSLDDNGNSRSVNLGHYSESGDNTTYNTRGLHRRIGMRALKNRKVPVNREVPVTASLQQYVPAEPETTTLAEATQNANNAVANLDQMIASLGQVELPADNKAEIAQSAEQQVQAEIDQQASVLEPFVPTPEEAAYAPVPEETPVPYNYTVVYSYSAPEPRDEMWVQLEEAGEQDKWRGVNLRKPAWFIYVGAYYSKRDAIDRQQMLLSMVGENPELRNRARNHAVAAK